MLLLPNYIAGNALDASVFNTTKIRVQLYTLRPGMAASTSVFSQTLLPGDAQCLPETKLLYLEAKAMLSADGSAAHLTGKSR